MAESAVTKSDTHPKDGATCNCALLCVDVEMSRATGQHTLRGIVNLITVAEFPAVLGGYITYVRISSIFRTQKIRVAIEDATTEEPLVGFYAELEKPTDPFGMHLLMVQLPLFEVKEPGRYLFMVRANDVPIVYSPVLIVGPSRLSFPQESHHHEPHHRPDPGQARYQQPAANSGQADLDQDREVTADESPPQWRAFSCAERRCFRPLTFRRSSLYLGARRVGVRARPGVR